MTATRQFGDCIVETAYPECVVTVVRADPRILVDAQVLEEIRAGCRPGTTVNGDVLTVEGDNQRVIYRIGEYLPEHHAYVAEWPD